MRAPGQARRWAVPLLVAVLCAWMLPRAEAQASKPTPTGKTADTVARALARLPLVLVQESNPWIGDRSTLALYADGTLIYWKQTASEGGYFAVKLSESELGEFLKHLEPLETAAAKGKFFPDHVAPDMPITQVTIRLPQKKLFGSVFPCVGTLRWKSHRTDWTQRISPSAATFQFLETYEHPSATPWVPEAVRLVLWPAPKTDEEPLPWPADFPSLKEALKSKEDGSYVLTLERARYEKVAAFLAQRKPHQRLLINGQLWLPSVQLLFPHEYPTLAPAVP
jgi:hypothetical protein